MNTPLKTIEAHKKPSHIFDYIALLIVAGGISLFYVLKINMWLKWGIVLLSLTGAILIFFLVSTTGLNLHGFFRDSWRELSKVVWPTRKEAMQFTWVVFLFVIILSLFLWLIDSSLSWLLYTIILGKGK